MCGSVVCLRGSGVLAANQAANQLLVPMLVSQAGVPKLALRFPAQNHSHLSSTPWLPMSSTCNHSFCDFIKQLLLFCILTTTSLLYHGKYFSSVSWQVLLFCIMATTSLLYHGKCFSSVSWQLLLFCILATTSLQNLYPYHGN